MTAWRFDGFDVVLLRGLSPARADWERRLDAAQRPLPLPHRAAWAAVLPPTMDSWFFAITDADGAPAGALGVQVAPSRALPGHLLLRCERFGPGVAPAARGAALTALVAAARANTRVLRLTVETFALDDGERTSLEQQARELGFAPVAAAEAHAYTHTLVLPLDGTEDEIFEGLHKTARRNIRQAGRAPVELRPIEDPALFPRMDEISRETYARTGGTYHRADWAAIVALSQREPSRSRLVGLFRSGVEGPEALLAFAWANGHGDHAHYSRSGSTRAMDLKVSVTYPLLWDLVCWAKRHEMRCFDFGGVTAGDQTSDDPLGGISDFKRYFTERRVQVGADWTLEPHPARARTARALSTASAMVTRARVSRVLAGASLLLARLLAHRATRG